MGPLYLTVGVTKNRSLRHTVAGKSGQSPVFPVFMILHSSAKEEMYNVMFGVLFEKMNALYKSLQGGQVGKKKGLSFNFKFDFAVLDGDLAGRKDITAGSQKDIAFHFASDCERSIFTSLLKKFIGSMHIKCAIHVYKDVKEYMRKNKTSMGWDSKTRSEVKRMLCRHGIADTKDYGQMLKDIAKLRQFFSLLSEKHRNAMEYYLRVIIIDIHLPCKVIGNRDSLLVSN